MSFEINPVLAGVYDAPGYAPAHDFSQGIEKPAEIDPRRYTKFDRTAANVDTVSNFSFGDFLDMINPLQHIPVLSSALRTLNDGQINPVARVAGDMMYGGLFGGASAIIGGLGAVADSMIIAESGQEPMAQVASLFKSSPDAAAAPVRQTAQNETPQDIVKSDIANEITAQDSAPKSKPAENVAQANPAAIPLPVTSASTATPAPDATADSNAAGATPAMTLTNAGKARAFPLNRNKQPYGGVMDMSAARQAQEVALAMNAGLPAGRIGHTIYLNRFMHLRPPRAAAVTSPVPLTPAAAKTATASASDMAAATATPAAAPATNRPLPGSTANANANAATGLANVTAGGNPLPPALVQDMMMKALSQYQGMAGGVSPLGSVIDLNN